MSPEYPLHYEPATPGYVFEVFRYIHRCAAAAGDADPDDPPRYDTPWCYFADYVHGDDLGLSSERGWVNGLLGAKVRFEEWDALFGWFRGPTVGQVCEVVARSAWRPVIRPWHHVAGGCPPAGAFLTVRAILTRMGAGPDEIRPWTRLQPYLCEYWDRGFLERLMRLAPDRLPPHYTRAGSGLFGLPTWSVPPARVEFGCLRTFRDLAYALAGQPVWD